MESEELQNVVATDSKLQQIITKLQDKSNEPTSFSMVHGHYKNGLVIPGNSEWVQRLLKESHQIPFGGHFGAFRTMKRLAASVYWVGMK